MIIDVSDIVKLEGASIDVEFREKLENLEALDYGVEFHDPVSFKGSITNIGGILKLAGNLEANYRTKCYRCLKDIGGKLSLPIRENFLKSTDEADNKTDTDDDDAYFFEGNHIVLDKVIRDNIVLNLPMKEICSKECKGLCPKCGKNLNEGSCDCRDDYINPQMEALKEFFKNN